MQINGHAFKGFAHMFFSHLFYILKVEHILNISTNNELYLDLVSDRVSTDIPFDIQLMTLQMEILGLKSLA